MATSKARDRRLFNVESPRGGAPILVHTRGHLKHPVLSRFSAAQRNVSGGVDPRPDSLGFINARTGPGLGPIRLPTLPPWQQFYTT